MNNSTFSVLLPSSEPTNKRHSHTSRALGDDCGAISGMNECQEKPKHWEKTCPNAALSSTDPI
jgi:hypothetical protein